MNENSERKIENTKELSIDTIDIDDIDYTDAEAVRNYAMFAGNAVADKILEDPTYLNQHNDLADLAYRNVAAVFDRMATGNDISGVSKENLDTMNYYQQLMSGEAAICGNDSRYGAHSLQSVVSDGNLPASESAHIANHLKDCNELISRVFKDPNVEVGEGVLLYMVNNAKPILGALKRQNEAKAA